MKVRIELEDVILNENQEGVTLTIVPLEEIKPEDYEKEPTKAMWIASTLIELFNTGAIQPIVEQYKIQVGAATGVEGPPATA